MIIQAKFHGHVDCSSEDMLNIPSTHSYMIHGGTHHHIFQTNTRMIMKHCIALIQVSIYMTTKFHDHARCRLEDMMNFRTSRFCTICVPTHHHIFQTTPRKVMRRCMSLYVLTIYRKKTLFGHVLCCLEDMMNALSTQMSMLQDWTHHHDFLSPFSKSIMSSVLNVHRS